MALTPFQRAICRLLALAAPRVSRDLDIFHDTTEAVAVSWDADRRLLGAAGYTVEPQRERPGFVEAVVTRDGETVIVEWLRDSAYRFFPLVEHEEFGLALHPLDLATNKVLALIGRTEVRDWIDVIECHRSLQPLGYLSWAACGKDPGFTPAGILAHAARASRYSQAEIDALAFEGPSPSARELSRHWHAALDDARAVVASLPVERAGMAVLDRSGTLFRGTPDELQDNLKSGTLQFHEGRIRGAWPRVR